MMGNFNLRDKVWQKFYREHKKGKPGHEARVNCAKEHRDQFQKDWARTTYGKILAKKFKQETWEVQDVSIGEYMCFGALVVKLGGWTWAPAVKSAKRLFYLCAQLGGKWFFKEDFTGLHHALVMK